MFFEDLLDYITGIAIPVVFLLLTVWGLLELFTLYNVIGGVVQ